MLKILNKFVSYVENKQIGIVGILISVLVIASIRNMFELLYKFGYIFPKPNFISTYLTFNGLFVHFNSFWLAIFITLTIILYLFTAKNNSFRNVLKFSMFGMLIIIFPVLFDFLIGNKDMMLYPNNPIDLYINLKHYFNINYQIFGISPGMRYEVFLVSIFSGFYVYLKNKKIVTAIIAPIVIFLVISFFGAWISFFAQIYEHGFKFTSDFLFTTSTFFSDAIIKNHWTMYVSLVYSMITISGLAFIYWSINKTQFNSIIKNFRPTRILHYLILFVAGIAVSKIFYLQQNHLLNNFKLSDAFIFTNPNDILSIIGGILAIFFSFEASVIFNDYYDYKIDVVSNPNRPLIRGTITTKQYLTLGILFLISGLFLSYTISVAMFLFVLSANLLAYMYSNEPFRLKKYFFINYLLIGLISLFVFHAGSSLLLKDRTFTYIPANLSYAIVFGYAIVSSIKDIKDYDGDKQNGIQTIVTLFGQKAGKIIITILISATIILLPLFLKINFHIIFAGIFAIAFVLLMYSVKNNEKYIFGLYYVYITIIFLKYLILLSNL